ncbi:hypothetical protein EGP98_00815 [bacterium]|nr:hypothetical protein [bacterium]
MDNKKIEPVDFDILLKEVLNSDDQLDEEEIVEIDEFDENLLKDENNLELTDEDEESYLEEDISIDE